jgi:hypothetical protein
MEGEWRGWWWWSGEVDGGGFEVSVDMRFDCGGGLTFSLCSLKCIGSLHVLYWVWQVGVADTWYGHAVCVGMIVPVVVKSSVIFLSTQVDLVMVLARESSLTSLDFLLLAFIFAQNKWSRIFAHVRHWLPFISGSSKIFVAYCNKISRFRWT